MVYVCFFNAFIMPKCAFDSKKLLCPFLNIDLFIEEDHNAFVLPFLLNYVNYFLCLHFESMSNDGFFGWGKNSVEYSVSYVYHALFAYFDRDNVALKGLAK